MVLLVTKVPKTSLLRFLLASIKISFSFFMKVQKKSYFLNRHDWKGEAQMGPTNGRFGKPKFTSCVILGPPSIPAVIGVLKGACTELYLCQKNIFNCLANQDKVGGDVITSLSTRSINPTKINFFFLLFVFVSFPSFLYLFNFIGWNYSSLSLYLHE